MASGWTGGLIAPDMRVHDAAHAAIDSTGGSVSHAIRTAASSGTPTVAGALGSLYSGPTATGPALAGDNATLAQGWVPGTYVSTTPPLSSVPTPTAPDMRAALATQVLHDPTLGSRGSTGLSPRSGAAPVGSASVYQNGSIPNTITAAIANLGANSQNNNLASILQQILHGVGGSYTPSPQQNALYTAQTAQINQNMQTQALPGQIQAKIDAESATNPVRYGFSPPALPGQYNPAADTALQNLYGQQAQAKQAARGWTAPNY